MTFDEWVRATVAETLPPLRRPPPVRLFPHQETGAARLLDLLRRFGGALLFDGVGMGKSFTASAVAREWRDTGPIAAAVPAPLLATWRATLARFGVDAHLVSHDAIAALHPLAAGSLLIVDEAHRFRNKETLRHRRLAERYSSALLLVTATPLCNTLDDVRSLVRLAFADDVLKAYGMPSLDEAFDAARGEEIRSMLALLGVRREPHAPMVFPASVRRVIRFSLGETGQHVMTALGTLEVPLCQDGASPALLRSHLRARLESSPDALRDSLERQRRFYRRAREKLFAGFTLRRADFASLFETEERELFQDLLFPEAFLPKAGPESGTVRIIESELGRIDDLLATLMDCESEKFERLDDALRNGIALPAIVFTRAIPTARRLWSSFAGRFRTGLASSRGAVDPRGVAMALDDLLRSFRSRSIDLLILTDLASEGLDLQAAATVVHFDLPWTAVKLDQRNGRAIRIGQTRDSVRSIYFVPATPGERSALRFVSRKERLANRYLAPSPWFAAVGVPCGPDLRPEQDGIPVRVAAMGDAIVIIERGAVYRIAGGVLSADPCAFRGEGRSEVRPTDDGLMRWDEWKEAALLVPSRVQRASPQAALARALSPDARARVLDLLGRRYRSGSERALAELAIRGSDAVEAIETLLAQEPGALEEGDNATLRSIASRRAAAQRAF